MNVSYTLPGTLVLVVGCLLIIVLLGSVGALERSKQLAAFGELASGRAGRGKRRLFFIALALLVFGACGTFAGVAANDKHHARACADACARMGYSRGFVEPSRRQTRCVCSGGTSEPIEIHDDSL